MLGLGLVALFRSGGFLKNALTLALQIGVDGVNQPAALISRQASLYQIVNPVGISFGYLWPSGQVTQVLQRFFRSWPLIRLLAVPLLWRYRRSMLLRLACTLVAAVLLGWGWRRVCIAWLAVLLLLITVRMRFG